MMRRLLGPVMVCAALLGCERAVTPIGDAEADRAAWASSSLFAHYRGALTGASTVGELLTQPLSFSARPTPRALLEAQRAANPPAAPGAVPLSVLTYNVALLDVSLFGFVPFTSTPHLDARRPLLAAAIFSQGYDVIGLQELWGSADVARFRQAAEAAGYWLVTSPRDGYTDGLALAVRRGVAAAPESVWFEHYSENSANEFFPAPGLSRGFLGARIQSASLGPVVVYVTHTAAFPSAYQLRMRHARELGLDVQRRVRADELLFLLGDFNAAPYYRADVWTLPDGAAEPGWYANTLSYPVLLHYTGARDLAVQGRSMADVDLDITAADAVPSTPSRALAVPFGVDGYCATAPRDAFSGTDCNALYFEQYAGTEFPARLDYVFGRGGARIHVAESRLAFTDPVAYDGVTGPLSDHYGQLVRLLVAPL